MENSTKAIIIGVALFITISVVSAVMLITGIGTDAMNSSNQQLAGVASNVASQLLADYDVQEMTGANVIASVKKFYDKQNFILCVDTSNTDGYYEQKWFADIKNVNLMEPSTNGTSTGGARSFRKSDKTKYMGFLLRSDIKDIINDYPNERTAITGLSNIIDSTDMYMSYIIYLPGTDTVMGVYFKNVS